MDGPLLLDTCAAIWISNDDAISEQVRVAVDRAHQERESIYISPITAWELGLLVARGRLNLSISPQHWFFRLLQTAGLRLADMQPEILINSSFLPGTPPRDPADRIIATTAREYGYTLVTRDRPLLDYARHGHISVLEC